MELPSQSLVDLLTYLLPGFITAALVFGLTAHPRPTPFERIVQALIFTMLVQVIVLFVREALLWGGRQFWTLGTWSSESQLVVSVLAASGLGLVVAYLANTDRLLAFLRRKHITQRTSYSSEWYGALCRNQEYVVLHLSGGRRLYGWPEEWPITPGEGHFVLVRSEWLEDEKRIELQGVDKVLISASDVELVEIMKQFDPNEGAQAK